MIFCVVKNHFEIPYSMGKEADMSISKGWNDPAEKICLTIAKLNWEETQMGTLLTLLG